MTNDLSELESKLLSKLDLNSIKSALNESELNTVESILRELSTTGNSHLLSDLYEADYEEVPVDIDTFVKDPRFLGKSFVNDEGNCLLYPYWIDVLKSLYAPDSPYYECAITGSIGTGKTTIMVVGMLYILHKLLCLKDPAKYYGLSGGSKVALAFINVDMSAAYGVAYSRLQEYCKKSSWFLEHGSLVGLKNPTYYPSKNIDIVVGSKSQHFIGRDIFCVTGDTKIVTDQGTKLIKDCKNQLIRVLSYNSTDNSTSYSNFCYVVETARVDHLIELELEDHSVLRCTPAHRFLLKDGSYKRAIDLTEDDDLMG